VFIHIYFEMLFKVESAVTGSAKSAKSRHANEAMLWPVPD
jgi:hypothetical protein